MQALPKALSLAAIAVSVALLSGCYVVPVNPEGYPAYPGYPYAAQVSMQSARQGAGTCTLSDGAKYQVHIGS